MRFAVRSTVFAAALALAACAQERGVPAGDAPATSSPAEPVSTVSSITGEFVVASIDGETPNTGFAGDGPQITIGPKQIHFRSQCIYANWNYEQAGEAISAARYYVPGSAMCARGLVPAEVAIQASFDQLERITGAPGGGLIVEGAGHRLVLAPRRGDGPDAAFAGNLAGEWRVAGIDGAEIGKPYAIALSGNGERIWWGPACAMQYREYRIEGGRFATRPHDLSGRQVCEIGYPEELPRIWSAMDAANSIERTSANGVLISGKGRSVTLFSQ